MSGPIRADAVVVAAGQSTRMEGVDKIGATLLGRPLLAWTLAAVAAADEVERIVLVAPEERVALLREGRWVPPKVVAVVAGGPRRQESVNAGVRALDAARPLDPDRPVLVHDGARPAVSPGLVAAVARATVEHGAAIPVVPVVETLKRVVDGRIAGTVDRTDVVAAQTPQGVRAGLLARAWAIHPVDGPATFTDEASLLEACRIAVHAIPGEAGNVKVTVPADLPRAERALSAAGRPRVGFGEDSHPFGPGAGLALGGIRIDEAPRLYGHSDGDVALHALADALLGAAGLGDLGRLFPADERTPRGVSSAELVAEVVRRVADVGLRPASVDVSIVAGRPRMGARLDEMRRRIAELLGLAEDAVDVKASTGNLGGDEGAGRSVSARAVAVLEPLR